MSANIGQVRCNKIIHFRQSGDKTHPKIDNFININVTSGTNSKWKKLSPMILGPFNMEMKLFASNLYPNGIEPGYIRINDSYAIIKCTNLENLWQGSKVYDIDLDKNDNIKPSFFERRLKMVIDVKPHRRAVPKSKGTTVFLFWENQRYLYLESRFIYCNIYSYLVQHTQEFRDLVDLHNNGTNLLILGYDGVDTEITEETMRYHYNDASKPFGHELVICCLLCGFTPWINN
jgi:hypothetical protein